jgi:hypothetical protein
MSRKLVISDTGFIVALLNQTDQKHNDVSVVYLQHEKILLPQTVLVEVAYLVKREAGNQNFPAASGRGMEDVLLANRRFPLQVWFFRCKQRGIKPKID